MSRVSFHTLGCKLNYAETSTIARDFRANGYETVPFETASDVTVINTCTVTEQAEAKCRNAIRRALRANPDTFVIVTGCYAQLRPEEISKIPGVDMVLGAQEKFRIFSLIEAFEKQNQTQVAVSCIDDVTAFGPSYSSGERTRAFLKVQDGCDYICSFCTIPQARGKSRSASIQDTLKSAREVAQKGYKEIVLTGINIGLYGQEHGTDLLALLQELDQLDGVERFRISSIEPNLLTNEIIHFVAASHKFQPHFHIPLQSGDNEVLGKMRRRYRRELYADRVQTIRTLMPHACIGVDVIVGFPAETETHFEETYLFLNELPVSYFHVFTYSERPHTTAVDQIARMGTPVPQKERERRSKMLRILSAKKRLAFHQAHTHTTRSVLWEDEKKGELMFGFTDNYVKVQAAYDVDKVGHIENVYLGELAEDGTVKATEAVFISLL
ncbi:MAG: tRNA (N(6)-L-threonylcarbamoyladenosine(37)-C(2))-methylthiotransferase MtaB [Rhodothermia bacterium]|nr:tRNA (N(6)-L-threonylcarbamoyladenosine(37)-C(2))-methylthiotransferase MtaB [Rhodothermia bacterium]